MAIKFDFTADNSNFIRVAKQTEDAVHDISSAANGAADSFKSMVTQAAGLAGISFGLAGMKQFTSKVFEVRSYFQDINSSMVAFLGNQEKADKFTKELKDYAWYNMFEFSDLAQASQQMIAYGVATEDIIPTIDKLSNIAVATKANLLDLVGMYNKAKAVGSVGSQALQSWATRGLSDPVIKQALKDMGEEANSTTLTFEQLDKVLTKVTSEGGLFYGQQEKMMDNLSSSLGQLQDDMDSAFNEIGESLQQPMKSAIEFASELVDNYKEIAKNIAEITAAYGVYRAALLASNSIDKTAGTIVYQAEVEAMREAIVVKEQVEYKDLEEAVAKGKLTKASAERIASLRAEIAAEEEEYESSVRSKVARGALTEAQGEELISLHQTIAHKEDLANVEEALAQKALENAQSALSAANTEKESADERVEVLKNLLSITEEEGDAEKASALAEQLNDAVEKQHIATENAESAAVAANTAQENLNTASRNVNTAATVRQEVAQVASIKAMGLAKAASIQLRNIIASLNATMDANPIGLIAAAVTALGYAVYKLATYETDAEKAARELNEAHSSFITDTQREQKEIDRLFGTLKKAKEGTEQYNDTKKAIMSKYGQYLSGLREEISSLKDVEAAYRAVSAAAKDAARNRALDKHLSSAKDAWDSAYSAGYEKLREGLVDFLGNEKKASEYLELIRQNIEENGLDFGYITKLLGTSFVNINSAIKKGASEMVNANKVLEKTTEDANAMFGVNTSKFDKWKDSKIESTIKAAERLKEKFIEGRKAILKFSDGTQEEFFSTEAIDVFIKKLNDAKEAHKDLTEPADNLADAYETAKTKVSELSALVKKMEANRSDYTTKEYEEAKTQLSDWTKKLNNLQSKDKSVAQANKDAKHSAELAEIERKRGQEQLRVRQETALELRKLENSIEKDRRKQALDSIDIEYDESMEKVRQKEIEYQEAKIDAAREAWSKAAGRKDTDIFDVSSVDTSLTYEEKEYLNALRVFYAKRKQQQKEQLTESDAIDYNNYLLEYGNYEQKKTAIREKYDKIRENASEGVRLKADKDEQRELSDLESRFEKIGNAIVGQFGKIEKKTKKNIRNVTDEMRRLIKVMEDGMITDEERQSFIDNGILSDDYIESVETLETTIADVESDIDSLEGEAKKLSKAFAKIGDAWKDCFGKNGEVNEDNLNALLGAINNASSSCLDLAGGIATIADSFGDSDLKSNIEDVGNVLQSTLSMAAAGAQVGGGWGALAGAVIGLGAGLAQVLSRHADKEQIRAIEEINDRIKSLSRSYEALEEQVDKTYSSDKQKNIKDEIKNLEAQNRLIEEQIAQEESKKHTDDNAIEAYKDSIYENQKRIQELREQAEDAIFGSDIKSAIENFADAYADAWSNGTDRVETAREQVRKMMQGMVRESIKAATEASGAMENIRKKLAEFMLDGVLSKEERAIIDSYAEDLQQELDNRFDWAEDILRNDGSASGDTATNRGMAAMSQDTANELNGRFAASQMAIEQQVQTLLMIHQLNQTMCQLQQNILQSVNELKDISSTMAIDQQDIVSCTKRITDFGNTLQSMDRKLMNL